MVKKVTRVRRVREDRKACKEQSVTKDRKAPKVSKDPVEKRARLDLLARRVNSESQDSLVILDHLEKKETKAHRVDQELLVTRATEVTREHQESGVNKVHEDSEEAAAEQADKE